MFATAHTKRSTMFLSWTAVLLVSIPSHPALKLLSFVPPLLLVRILGNFHLLTLTTLNKCQRVATPHIPFLCVRKIHHLVPTHPAPILQGSPGQVSSESAGSGRKPQLPLSSTTNEPSAPQAPALSEAPSGQRTGTYEVIRATRILSTGCMALARVGRGCGAALE